MKRAAPIFFSGSPSSSEPEKLFFSFTNCCFHTLCLRFDHKKTLKSMQPCPVSTILNKALPILHFTYTHNFITLLFILFIQKCLLIFQKCITPITLAKNLPIKGTHWYQLNKLLMQCISTHYWLNNEEAGYFLYLWMLLIMCRPKKTRIQPFTPTH